MTEVLFVYVTTPSREIAVAIARAAVESRLAACGNVLPSGTSVYRWKGKVEEAEETVLILKTTAPLFDELADFVRARHPYDCPCIVALDIKKGTPDFLAWIELSVKGNIE